MTFQTNVRLVQTTGIVGDIIFDSPRRAHPGRLQSTDPALNVVGRGFSHVAGSDDEVTADTPGAFAGILINSKNYASRGTTAGGTLAPTLTLANNEEGEFLTMGIVIVALTTDGDIGENVFYSDTTGEIAADPTTTLAGHTIIPNAKVVRQNIPAPGLAFIQLTS